MWRAGLFAALTLAGCAPVEHGTRAMPITRSCAAEAGYVSICGPVATEDLVAVPRADWLIGSGLDIGGGGHLYLIEVQALTAFAAQPGLAEGAGSPECPAPPGRLSTSGLAMLDRGGGQSRLFAVNHGARKAIEIYDVRSDGAGPPMLEWHDCVPLPADVFPNAVAVLPDGSLVITSFRNEADPESWNRLNRGEAHGKILSWNGQNGLQPIEIGHVSGPNGVAVSGDGQHLYLSDWAGRRVLVIDRTSQQVARIIALPFLPDNIHPLPDGRLLVAGQHARPSDIGACGPSCPQAWQVAAINPLTGEVKPVAVGAGTEQVNYAAAALAVSGRLFVTVRGDGRILVRDWPQAALSMPRSVSLR